VPVLFKNVIVYRIEPTWSQDLVPALDALGPHRFVPCGPSQEKSAGWVEPRGQEHGPLIESVGGQWLLDFMIESKAVPASVVRRKVDERCAQIEATTGRKPGKKEKRDLKEDIAHELLPLAFSRVVRVSVWIDPVGKRLTINSSNATRADEIVTALVSAFDGFSVALLQTQMEPAAAMSNWLSTQEPPAGFTIDRECELRATDESKSVVRYAKHALDIDEVRQHIAGGKRPTRLAMTWDDRVSFELTDSMQIRKIAFIEGTLDATGTTSSKEDDFDADAAIATGELGQLLPELLAALGGEMQLGGAESSEKATPNVKTASAAPIAEPEDAPF
jgi:recombination associated protein RdgC